MPSALWTYYDRELRAAVRAAHSASDADRLAALLAQAIRFEQLVALVDPEPRLAEVHRDVERLVRRLAELSVPRA
jgi:hypothetical protein